MEENRRLIGERIKKARKNAGLTQTELGEKLCLGLRHIQKIEKGETGITLDRVEEISKVLNVPANYFLATTQNEKDFFCDIKDGLEHYSKKPLPRTPVDEIICEYTRNEETLRLIFPSHISTEDMKEKVEVLVRGIFGAKI